MNHNDRWSRFHAVIPTKEEILLVLKSFSMRERYIIFAVALWCAASFFWALDATNRLLSDDVPTTGGELVEGIVGTPRFVNPLLAISDADRDLTALVYSGLMKKNPDGSLSPDLAAGYEISPDGLSYTFTLKEDARFHDGTPVTADDVEFTVNRAKDPLLKSPRRASWEGVTVEKVSDHVVAFTLKQSYFPFLENTTLGILPKHIWGGLNSEQFSFSDFNVEGVGSGPYEVHGVRKSSSGIPNYFELRAYRHYVSGEPYITTLKFNFYPNEAELIAALEKGAVKNASAINSEAAARLVTQGFRVETAPLPRVFGVFFNHNQNAVFADRSVRLALDAAIDKERIIEHSLSGYASVIDSPLPSLVSSDDESGTTTDRAAKARDILERGGWKWNEEAAAWEKKKGKETTRLSFSLSTGDIAELTETARLIAEDWETVGIGADLKIFETGDLNQNIIRPRRYDALLFGEIVGFNPDPLPFWHSSQRNDPGLNIALYTNAKADKALEEIRTTLDPEKRAEKYAQFEREVRQDAPAIFLYAPDFIYVVGKDVRGLELGNVTVPSDRFMAVEDWHIVTDRVWKPLARWATRTP